jgi:hypothetical protein
VGDANAVKARRWPLLLTAALAAGALAPDAVLRDAVTLAPVRDVALHRSLAYVLLAPLCEAFDALTLLSRRQHAAVIATTLVLLVAWRIVLRARRGAWRPARDLAAVGGGMLALAALYAADVFVPRPIAALVVTDPDVVAVDFHSHTSFSHDGRRSFSPARNRAWHRAGGWDVAYVTDHGTLVGARQALGDNPPVAGAGTVLLPGVEMRMGGLQLIVLGLRKSDLAALRARARSRSSGMPRAARPAGSGHVTILTVPITLEYVRRHRRRPGGAVAIEIADGGVRGLEQQRRDHDALVALAEARDFTPVSGSNNHGWSQTANAWTLLRIPGWRALAPAALETRIETLLRTGGFAGARVVERHAADGPATPLGVALTVPAVAWHVLATLTAGERLACLGWIWGLAVVGRRRRLTRTAPTS